MLHHENFQTYLKVERIVQWIQLNFAIFIASYIHLFKSLSIHQSILTAVVNLKVNCTSKNSICMSTRVQYLSAVFQDDIYTHWNAKIVPFCEFWPMHTPMHPNPYQYIKYYYQPRKFSPVPFQSTLPETNTLLIFFHHGLF